MTLSLRGFIHRPAPLVETIDPNGTREHEHTLDRTFDFTYNEVLNLHLHTSIPSVSTSGRSLAAQRFMPRYDERRGDTTATHNPDYTGKSFLP
jgi:hypothetical protein